MYFSSDLASIGMASNISSGRVQFAHSPSRSIFPSPIIASSRDCPLRSLPGFYSLKVKETITGLPVLRAALDAAMSSLICDMVSQRKTFTWGARISVCSQYSGSISSTDLTLSGRKLPFSGGREPAILTSLPVALMAAWASPAA